MAPRSGQSTQAGAAPCGSAVARAVIARLGSDVVRCKLQRIVRDPMCAQERQQRIGAQESVALPGAHVVQLVAQHGRLAGDAQHIAGQRRLGGVGSSIGHAASLRAERQATVNAEAAR